MSVESIVSPSMGCSFHHLLTLVFQVLNFGIVKSFVDPSPNVIGYPWLIGTLCTRNIWEIFFDGFCENMMETLKFSLARTL